MFRTALFLAVLFSHSFAVAQTDDRFPLFTRLTSNAPPRIIAYTPSQLDPRQEANQRGLATTSIRKDLEALRPAFEGLVLYGYHEACTPRIVEVAKGLKYDTLFIAVWDVRSSKELEGAAKLAAEYEMDFAIGVLVGNEGITFNRYEPEDLKIAGERIRRMLPKTIPIGTSEPLVGYEKDFVRDFGDFLAPNIHPFFDRPLLAPPEAAAWAREEAGKLADKTKKPVILKETGLPHAGKTHSEATQKEFWSAYTKPGLLARSTASKSGWSYHGVGFEAFDLPWKSEESKLEVEKSWGLMSPSRKPYAAFEVWKNGK